MNKKLLIITLLFVFLFVSTASAYFLYYKKSGIVIEDDSGNFLPVVDVAYDSVADTVSIEFQSINQGTMLGLTETPTGYEISGVSVSTISGLQEALDLKYDAADFNSDFDTRFGSKGLTDLSSYSYNDLSDKPDIPAQAIVAAKTIPLDDFSEPEDNTDLDFNTSRHGLTPKGTNVGDYLKDDGTWSTINSESVEVNQLGTPTYQTVQDWLNIVQSAGKIEGWEVSDGGSGTLNISSGKGFLKVSSSETSEIKFFDLAGTTGLSLTDNSNNWICVDYNSGSPIYVSETDLSNIDFTSKILIGQAYRSGSTVYAINAGPFIPNNNYRTARRAFDLRRVERASGLVISETGTRNISMSEGKTYYGTTYQEYSALDTSGTDSFTYHYHSSGSWTTSIGQTQIDKTQYDDGTDLATLGVGRYGVHWIYLGFDGLLHIVYGQGSYKLSEANDSQPPANLPDFIEDFAFIIGRVIILRDSDTFEEIKTAFETYFSPSIVSNHNDLGLIQGGTTDEYYHLNLEQYTGFSTQYDAYVCSSNCDYTTLGAAVSGESIGASILVLEDTTETQNTSIKEGQIITVKDGKTIDLGSSYKISTTSDNVKFNGNFTISSSHVGYEIFFINDGAYFVNNGTIRFSWTGSLSGNYQNGIRFTGEFCNFGTIIVEDMAWTPGASYDYEGLVTVDTSHSVGKFIIGDITLSANSRIFGFWLRTSSYGDENSFKVIVGAVTTTNTNGTGINISGDRNSVTGVSNGSNTELSVGGSGNKTGEIAT